MSTNFKFRNFFVSNKGIQEQRTKNRIKINKSTKKGHLTP